MTKGLQSAAHRICSPKANKFHTCRLRSIFAQTGQHGADVPVDADGLLLNLPGGGGLAQRQAYTARGLAAVIRQKGYLMITGVLYPTPSSRKRSFCP